MADHLARSLERQDELSVTELLRLGRLDPKHVSIAAYLGDERAIHAGLMVPKSTLAEIEAKDARDLWPARLALLYGDFTARQSCWLACLVAEHPVSCGPGSYGAGLIEAARAWCRGFVTKTVVRVVRQAVRQLVPPSPGAMGDARHSLLSATQVAASERVLYRHPGTDEDVLVDADWRPAGAAHASRAANYACLASDGDEPAWQAQAIANCLLGPEGFPWNETEQDESENEA